MMTENEQRALSTMIGAFAGWAANQRSNTGRVLAVQDRVGRIESDPTWSYIRDPYAADLLAGLGYWKDDCCEAPKALSEEEIRAFSSPPAVSRLESVGGLPGTLSTGRVVPGELYKLGRLIAGSRKVRAILAGYQGGDAPPEVVSSTEGRVQLYRAAKGFARRMPTKNLTQEQYDAAWDAFASMGGAGGASGAAGPALAVDIGTPASVAVGATNGVLTAVSTGLGPSGTATLFTAGGPNEKNTLSSFNLRLSPAGSSPAAGEAARIAVPAGYLIDYAVDAEVHFGNSTAGGNIDGVKPYAVPTYVGGSLAYISVGTGTALTASTVYDILIKVNRK